MNNLELTGEEKMKPKTKEAITSPVERRVRLDGLIHAHPGYKLENFLEDIDKAGGWPLGFKYVAFYHSVENKGRICEFSNRYLRTGWWTTICEADDYHWWKCSKKKQQKVIRIAKKQLMEAILEA